MLMDERSSGFVCWLAYFVLSGSMPSMKILSAGYGAGTYNPVVARHIIEFMRQVRENYHVIFMLSLIFCRW